MFQWRFFVILKLMISCMIWFMLTSNYNYTTDSLKNSISIIKQYFISSIYGQNKILNISYPSIVNKIDGYIDAMMSPAYVKAYYIKREG